MAPEVITVLGGGSWGTALALVLAKRFTRVELWVHNPELAATMETTRENPVYLPGFALPGNVRVSAVPELAPWVVVVVPSAHLRSVLSGLKPSGPVRIISATKGIEAGTFLRMTEIAGECLPGMERAAALSGPTFAREIAAGEPAAMVIASEDEEFAAAVQTAVAGESIRLYRNHDLVGVELAGALKNGIAIAAGAVEGLHLGSNSTAALITRGLAEITRLVVACGGEAATVAGLAGLGDLVLTCTGQLSRNRRVGIELARGRKLEAILADTRMVAEGVATTRVALELARKKGVEMPILSAVAAMMDGVEAREVLRQLVSRAPKAEGA